MRGVRVRLKGLEQVTRTLADGSSRTYWYAWRGGPRLTGAPGSAEFMRGYADAHATRKRPSAGSLAALVASYRASPEFARLAPSTRKQWTRWLGEIASETGPRALGAFPLAAFDDRGIKADIRAWRDQWAARPRSADYAIQVLSRLLSYAVHGGLIDANPCDRMGQLYASDRADTIWTPADLAVFDAGARNAWVRDILHVACLTGLRRGDLARLTWSHVGETAIVIRTGKTGSDALVPILPELAAHLTATRERQAALKLADEPQHVLTTSHGKPWSESGLTHAIAGIVPGKRLHDARGTFATRLRLAGLPASKIAAVMGWEEARVERLLSVYVDREAVVLDIARTISPKRLQNGHLPKT